VYTIFVNPKKYPKIGLALGSGSAKGLAHIGVIKVLEEHNIPIDYIAGCSIGAIIGAHYAAFKDSKRLETLFLDLNHKQGLRLVDPTFQGGFIKGKKFEKFIAEMLEGATFDSLQIPFAAVATDYHTATAIPFTEGDLVKVIRASSSVPAFFQPLSYHHHILADGGLSNPVPIEIVRKMGAEIVIAVNLDTIYTDNTINTPPITQVPMHAINILRHNLALYSAKTADIVIELKDPYQVGFIGWNYFFDTKKTEKIIQTGEEATQTIIPQLQQCIANKHKTHNILKRFLSYFSSR